MSTELDLTNALQRAVTIDDDHMRRLRERLAADAEAEHVLDVAYRTVDSPVGSLLLAATDTGLVRVAYASEDHDRVLEDLSSHISPRILRHPARLDAAARELDEYFAGRRKSFGLTLDWRLSTGFRATVLRHLGDIAYGRTASYAKVARARGSSQGGPRRRDRVRHQPPADRGALPPRRAVGRQHGRVSRRARREGDAARARGRGVRIEQRVDDLDWDAVFAGLDDVGIAPLGPILDDDECRELGALYDDDSLFRSTIDMARHRFGQGEYRYFAYPLPRVVAELRASFWPHLLPIAA